MKFKIGDKVIAKPNAPYSITNRKAGVMQVVDLTTTQHAVDYDEDIVVKIIDSYHDSYPVNSIYFELYKPMPTNYKGKQAGGTVCSS